MVNTFSQWVRHQRKVLGLTQRELARQAGCAEVTLRKIEAGSLHPSAQLVESLARALGRGDADLPYILEFALGAGEKRAPVAHKRRLRRAYNLPAQLTPLLGREQDIAAVRGRLQDGARLVTLVGPPGVGKTRLALAVAESVLEQFDHGVFFVRLGPVSDPDQVTPAIIQSLGFQMNGPNPPALQLHAFLETKHLLLVLDNLEHLVDSAAMLDDLLRRCPWLSMLVTSRQPLRVRGERQMPVLPLSLPVAIQPTARLTASDALRYPAVALFAERAQAVQPDFAVTDDNAAAVAELCRRLDGLPLAIELVAARVKLMPPAELLSHLSGPWMLSVDGLRDVSARQKTLRGAIDWSYDLLAADVQTLFARLAVFAGGCTLEAAEAVCGGEARESGGAGERESEEARATGRQVWESSRSLTGTPSPPLPLSPSPAPPHVLNGIASLLDKSLLRREIDPHGAARYVMLETVHEYALEQLAGLGETAAASQRHLAYYAHMLRRADAELYGPQRLAWYHWFDGELHNVQAALATAIAANDEAALALASTFVDYLIIRGRFKEARPWLTQALALPAAAPTPARAWALVQMLRLDFYQWDHDWRWPRQEEGLTISRTLGFRRGIGEAVFWLGLIAFHEGDRTRAAVNIAEALEIFQETGNPRRTVLSLCILGEIATELGDELARPRAAGGGTACRQRVRCATQQRPAAGQSGGTGLPGRRSGASPPSGRRGAGDQPRAGVSDAHRLASADTGTSCHLSGRHGHRAPSAGRGAGDVQAMARAVGYRGSLVRAGRSGAGGGTAPPGAAPLPGDVADDAPASLPAHAAAAVATPGQHRARSGRRRTRRPTDGLRRGAAGRHRSAHQPHRARPLGNHPG